MEGWKVKVSQRIEDPIQEELDVFLSSAEEIAECATMVFGARLDIGQDDDSGTQ